MTGTAGPLGRESMSFRDKMVTYHAEIERLVYAAEIACANHEVDGVQECSGCAFRFCRLPQIRRLIGKHPDQHDCSKEAGE